MEMKLNSEKMFTFLQTPLSTLHFDAFAMREPNCAIFVRVQKS